MSIHARPLRYPDPAEYVVVQHGASWREVPRPEPPAPEVHEPWVVQHHDGTRLTKKVLSGMDSEWRPSVDIARRCGCPRPQVSTVLMRLVKREQAESMRIPGKKLRYLFRVKA